MLVRPSVFAPPESGLWSVSFSNTSRNPRMLLPCSRMSIPDGRRFLQVLHGQFLCFALIFSGSPQNSCRFDLIYYLFHLETTVKCSLQTFSEVLMDFSEGLLDFL